MEDSDQESLGSDKSPQTHNNTVMTLTFSFPSPHFALKEKAFLSLYIYIYIYSVEFLAFSLSN